MKVLAKQTTLATLFFCVALLSVGCAGSKNDSSEGKLPLWHLEGESNDIWILGSVHMLPESAHPFPNEFDLAYEQAESLVFEIVLPEDPMSMMMGMVSKMMLPDGRTLKDELSPETWALLEPRLDEVTDGILEMATAQMGGNIPIELDKSMLEEMLQRFQPWVIGFILQQEGMEIDGYKAELGVDLHYMTKASDDNKPTVGLETIEEQLEMLSTLGGESGDAFVRTTLEEGGAGDVSIDSLVAAWKEGDLARLNDLINSGTSDAPEIKERLLLRRNRNWVPKIVDLLNDEEDFLVIVGAGHLVGEDSVIDLLRKEGLVVERL